MMHDRKSDRASVELVPRYRSPTSFEFVEGRCTDLSTGGMFIVAALPCESGTLLKFECAVEGEAAPLKGVARVVWRRTGGGEDRPSGMGLKFVKLEPGSEEVIGHLVSEAQSHGQKAPESPLPAQVKITESFPPQTPELESGRPPGPVTSYPQGSSQATAAVGGESEPTPAGAVVPEAVQPLAAAAKPASEASSRLPVAEPAPEGSTSSMPIWIALAVGGALLLWLLMRSGS